MFFCFFKLIPIGLNKQKPCITPSIKTSINKILERRRCCTVCARNSSGATWLAGAVVSRNGPLSFEVELVDGRILWRHTDHGRLRLTTTTETPCTVDGVRRMTTFSMHQMSDNQIRVTSIPQKSGQHRKAPDSLMVIVSHQIAICDLDYTLS